VNLRIVIQDLVEDILNDFEGISFGEDTYISCYYIGGSFCNNEYRRVSKSRFFIINIEFIDDYSYTLDSSSEVDSDGFFNINITIFGREEPSERQDLNRDFIFAICMEVMLYLGKEGRMKDRFVEGFSDSEALKESICFASLIMLEIMNVPVYFTIMNYCFKYYDDLEEDGYNERVNRVVTYFNNNSKKMILLETI
jgi:hypothetical protein